MAIQHVNRRNKTYYLHRGKTKTGKPACFFSMDPGGELADAIPVGFEIYENPNDQVLLRRIQPKILTGEELAVVKDAVTKHAGDFGVLVNVEKDAIVIYTRECGRLGAMMRFVLRDKKTRSFVAERWCFRGSVDGWAYMGSGDLRYVANALVPHLKKESFFDLYPGAIDLAKQTSARSTATHRG